MVCILVQTYYILLALLTHSIKFKFIEKTFAFAGVPITIKGSLAVKGMKFTSGSVVRKRHRAEYDAGVVALAKKAGMDFTKQKRATLSTFSISRCHTFTSIQCTRILHELGNHQ